eukprot:8991440-Karenia_brevis.AAC.1
MEQQQQHLQWQMQQMAAQQAAACAAAVTMPPAMHAMPAPVPILLSPWHLPSGSLLGSPMVTPLPQQVQAGPS